MGSRGGHCRPKPNLNSRSEAIHAVEALRVQSGVRQQAQGVLLGQDWERSDILALDETMENLSLKLSKASSAQEKDQIRLDQHRAYNEKKRLYLEELKRLRKLQPNKPKSATSDPNGLHEESLFYYRRRVMLERDYLATVLSWPITEWWTG